MDNRRLQKLKVCADWIGIGISTYFLVIYVISLFVAVSHILEIYEFPDSVTSDADAIFDEIKSSGARILKINSSSSQSLNNSHNGGGITNQRPTILAIFKCASEAQKALETVTSPYFKLRVSQKSPTHFAGNDHQNSSSTSPMKSGH